MQISWQLFVQLETFGIFFPQETHEGSLEATLWEEVIVHVCI